jgi:hypothetical protein
LGTEHGWTGEQKLYMITLVADSEYTIVVNSGARDMDVSIKMGETPYMINGISVDSGSTHEERMHFTSSKSGEYYIQIKVNSGSGFFYILVESGTTGSATGSNVPFFDVSYLLVLILPSLFILVLGLLIFKKLASRPEGKPYINIYRKDYWKKKEHSASKEETMICEDCGVEINKNLEKCPNCQVSLK